MFNLLVVQQQTPPIFGTGQQHEIPAAALGLLLGMIVVGVIIGLLIGLLVAWLIYKPYSKLPSQYHTLAPGLCFLLIVPLANIVMPIILGLKIPEAFGAYFADRGDTSVGDAGKSVGMWWGISALACLVPLVNLFAGIAALVLLIIFIIKLWDLAKRVEAHGDGGGLVSDQVF